MLPGETPCIFWYQRYDTPRLEMLEKTHSTTNALPCMTHATRTQSGKSAPGPKVAWLQKQILEEEQDYALW